jgi:outer membrane protein assembly factor BamD
MHRTTVTILTLWLFIASSLQAELSLNPFNWFEGDQKKAGPPGMQMLGAAEEAEALAILENGKSKLRSNDTAAANRIFKKLIKKYPRAKATAEALFLRGQIYISNEKWDKAFKSFQEIIRKHPEYEAFNQVIGSQFECATALMEGARGRILWIIPGFKQYSKSVNQFEQIVRNAPYSDYAPLALMNMAIVSEMQDKPEDAIDALDRLINYYPQSMLAPDAYYNMAQTYSDLVKGPQYDQGSTRQAISYYEDFLILFPESNYLGEVESNLESMEDLLARSRLNLGDFFYNYRSNNTAALVFYNDTITLAPESAAAEEARLRIQDIEAGVRPTTGASILQKILAD